MKEIILMLTAGGSSLGVALIALIASVMIIKEGWDSGEWYHYIMGLLLFFCAAIPAFGLFASLFFIGG